LKVLSLKPSSLGDVIHALPLLRLLKKSYPQAEVHWWIEESLAPLLEADPDLAALQIFRRRNWGSPLGVLREIRSVAGLRRERYDWVIDLQGLARSAWFGWFSRGAVMAGVDSGREGARGLYDVAVPRPSPETHAVDWNLEVARALGVDIDCDFEWLPAPVGTAFKLPDPGANWVAICPGARWPNKRWPTEHFSRLVKELLERDKSLRIVILGSAGDAESNRIISQSAQDSCLDLTGKTSLPEMVECLRSARVVVANDSGPLHVAVALNRPLVALYGPTHAGRTGPYGMPNSLMRTALPCAPCQVPTCANPVERECLRVISPPTVVDAVLARL
jgi:lipopolysaccharide heptosyltransferase I